MDEKELLMQVAAAALQTAEAAHSEDKHRVWYRPKFVEMAGSVLAAVFLQRVQYWDSKHNGEPFYKFNAPSPDNEEYAEGDSWQEELCFTRREFDGARAKVATKIKQGTSRAEAFAWCTEDGKLQSPDHLIVYWTSNNLTYYQLNRILFKGYLLRVYSELPDVQIVHYLGMLTGDIPYRMHDSDIPNGKHKSAILQGMDHLRILQGMDISAITYSIEIPSKIPLRDSSKIPAEIPPTSSGESDHPDDQPGDPESDVCAGEETADPTTSPDVDDEIQKFILPEIKKLQFPPDLQAKLLSRGYDYALGVARAAQKGRDPGALARHLMDNGGPPDEQLEWAQKAIELRTLDPALIDSAEKLDDPDGDEAWMDEQGLTTEQREAFKRLREWSGSIHARLQFEQGESVS